MRFFSTLIASIIGTVVAVMLFFFLGFLLILGLVASADTEPAVADGSTLVFEITGPIPERTYPDPFAAAFGASPSPDLTDIRKALRMAAVDERIDGVLLRIKSPSAGFGNWATLAQVRRSLLEFKESGKPLIATSGEFGMAQGSYYLASAADRVFAQPQSMFVFNGFGYTSAFFANTLEMLNIDTQVIRAGSYKSAIEPFVREDMSPESEEQMQALMQTTYDNFLTAVSDDRGLSIDTLRYLAGERGVIGSEAALQAGLLDGLLYQDEVHDLFPRDTTNGGGDDFDTIDLGWYAQLSASSAGIDTDREGTVAIVYAIGNIVPGDSDIDPFTQRPTALGSTNFQEAIREAREDDDVDGVVVRVSSPGGSASASETMRRAIAITSDEKPVIISMGDLAASGGYWMATSSDTIVAEPTTITGSIGVFGIFFDARGFFNEDLGITFDGVQTSPFADMGSPIGDTSPQEVELLQGWVNDTYDTFLQNVASSRDMTVEEVDGIAQGRIWSGRRAHELGLVDVLGGLPQALNIAADAAGLEEDAFYVRVLPRPKAFFESFFTSMGSQAARVWLDLRYSSAEQQALQYAMDRTRTLREVAGQAGTVQARMPWTFE